MASNGKRSEIISLLSEACELEHGLACSYLYAAFSIKQSASEGDITWDQLQYARRWAGQLYFIASQEMFHLSQAWNLLTALGGTPYYGRPNFPQSHRYYPIDLPLVLEPFGERALKRFIFYELPEHVSDVEFLVKEFHIPKERIQKAFTVGKLYESILNGIKQIPESKLFIGDPALQVGPEVCHFNEIVKVTNRETALRAIHTITEQGEGTKTDQLDCHYGLYLEIEREYRNMRIAATEKGLKFEPARKVIENPMPAFYAGQILAGANVIKNDFSSHVSVLFDNIYSLMLRMLQYVFQSGPLPDGLQKNIADGSIQLMTRVLKPLGEALTLLPSGHGNDLKCGPSFGLYRHVSFPANFRETLYLIIEALTQSADQCKVLSNNAAAPAQLLNATANLVSVQTYISNVAAMSLAEFASAVKS
ncbi:ferritin-like domain-containing protein [Mucilaginibacter sp. BT774]|uniref:ferritin-like domain-containing protein n=1 Tax=Mucilaginibacter sp. BT774 TaxID=3062276 RepID=UPI0026771BA9|nr:ferritin-like domain-containing protein [Mucilaginibacter sp. BT774]MDO3626116.1 ferritin-like domain-containing protein [Mucilaginibacter sp. BT774]